MAEELNWDVTEKHFNEIREAYQNLPVMSGAFGLSLLNKLHSRFESGERTQELFDEMMAVQ